MGLHGQPTDTGHTVVFVDNDELPDGVNWALIEFDGELHCVVNRSCVTEDVLEGAWSAYRSWGRWLSGHGHARTG